MTMLNAINWFEIPAVDFERAVAFYDQILGEKLTVGEFAGTPMAFFNAEPQAVGGAIVKHPEHQPGATGPMLYLNAKTSANIGTILERIPEAGGKILMPFTPITPHGYMAIFLDSEGNRLALHAAPEEV